jgi:nicotinamidase-related amidase
MGYQPLPVPDFFQPSRVEQVWRVPYQERAHQAQAWAAEHRLATAREDKFRICLLCIDVQNTFCLPDFELFVAGRSGRGAVEDNVRLCRFIYQNLGAITSIAPTLDTHTAMQIFHPVFWIDAEGRHPEPFTVIAPEDIATSRWRVNPAMSGNTGEWDREFLERHAGHYVRRLAEGGKYPLIIWPYHAMLGGIGHALVSAIEEAVFFHCQARRSQSGFEVKGANPLTENYSALRPEVLDTYGGRAIAEKNTRFTQKLLAFDAVVIAGQAKSHCVAWTIDDLLTEIRPQDPQLVKKVYLLEDCTSPVVSGGIDFTELAEAAFCRAAEAGVNVVRSTAPIASWPGIPL